MIFFPSATRLSFELTRKVFIAPSCDFVSKGPKYANCNSSPFGRLTRWRAVSESSRNPQATEARRSLHSTRRRLFLHFPFIPVFQRDSAMHNRARLEANSVAFSAARRNGPFLAQKWRCKWPMGLVSTRCPIRRLVRLTSVRQGSSLNVSKGDHF